MIPFACRHNFLICGRRPGLLIDIVCRVIKPASFSIVLPDRWAETSRRASWIGGSGAILTCSPEPCDPADETVFMPAAGWPLTVASPGKKDNHTTIYERLFLRMFAKCNLRPL